MPTTPHPANHSDNVNSTERKEITINTSSADSHPEADPADESANAPHHDDASCPCGALTDRNGQCRKCRARATWDRRQANRKRHVARHSSPHPSSSRQTDRGSNRPRGRRPGR